MENEHSSQPLILEWAGKWLAGKAKENRVPLLASLIVGLLCHMFTFTNKLVNHDEVHSLFSKGGTVTSGRWGLGLLDSIFPNFSMPWVYGILTIMFISIAICIIIHILKIKSKLFQVLLAGSVIAFPSLIGLFGYMFTSCSFGLSFLLAVLAVWFIQKPDWRYAIPALVCMVSSLSIYQSYISVAASLLVLAVLRQLMDGENIRDVFLRGIFFVVFLLVSLVVYLVGTQVVLRITGTEFSEYATNNLALSLSSILASIRLAYTNFFRFFTDGYHGLVTTSRAQWMHILCFVFVGGLLLVWCFQQERKELGRLVLILAMLLVLPLAINCMYLITTADAVHTLVLYGFISVYVLVAMVGDICLPANFTTKMSNGIRWISLNLVSLAMAVIITENIYVANEASLQMYLRYENAYSFYNALISDIKMTPGYDENTKLALIGYYDTADFFDEKFTGTAQIVGVRGFIPNDYSKNAFLEYYLGFTIPFASDEEIQQVMQTEEYQKMPLYPYYGSLQKIGDLLVVKLS